MGAANQTRDSSGKEPSHASNKGHGHGNAGEEDCGHSHGFLSGHHHHDTSYLVSKNRSDPGVRITNIGLVSNLAMAVAKFAGGYAFGSRAMVADAWHSVTDLASDILTLATVSWSIKSPTDRFPQGFGKVESLGALGVSSMLIVGGAYMGWESAITLFSAWNPEAAHHIMEHVGHGHSHSHSASALGIPSVHAAWLAAATIAVKEWLYYATMKVARERQSSVLASNAIHHRVDSLTGIVTLVAIIGANIFEQAAWLDPVGGLLISVMVVHAGCGNMLDSFRELVDQSIDEDVKKAVGKQARKAVANFGSSHEAELREVSGVKSGPNYLLDLEMSVPATWSIGYAREMEEAVRQRVGAKVRGAKKVRVRFVSQDEPASQKFDEFVNSAADRLGNPEPLKEEDENNSSGDEGSHKHDHKHRH
ncbi:hypothetical protein N3K66_008258 [Trichothecium roseum]|uniref:Uncharacterized protein n=1 Tax=Trichothecium roseum TaxID=47278 RepID=A0ACC0UT00_9HYPO|nr:hypothetical protein N3K66_008258 [Trichothecium roseum]